MSEKYVDIGNRLGYVRNTKLEMTQENMAERLGMSVEYYRLIEKGRFLLNMEMTNLLHQMYADIDYIFIGKEAGKSVFEDVLKDISEAKRENICRLIEFQMKNKLNLNHNSGNTFSANAGFVTMIYENEDIAISPDDRVREIILGEHNHGKLKNGKINSEKVNNEDIAQDLNKSQRTITRWLNGKTALKMDMVVAVSEKYDYSPAYILYGELNSNSQIDQYYEKLSDADKKHSIEFAETLVKFI